MKNTNSQKTKPKELRGTNINSEIKLDKTSDNHSPSQQDVCCNREDVHIKKSSNEGEIPSSDTNQQINSILREETKGLDIKKKKMDLIFSYYDVEEMLSKALSIKDADELKFLNKIIEDGDYDDCYPIIKRRIKQIRVGK